MKLRKFHPLLSAVLPALLAACSTLNGYHHPDPPPTDEPKDSAQNDRGMYLQLIRQMQQQGAYYASLAHIEAFRQRYGDGAELRLLQADALRETGQTDAAEKLYGDNLKGSQAAAAWHGLGLIDADRHQFDRAEQALAKAVQLDPLDTTYLGDLGFARLRAGQIDSAHDPLARAAELNPNNTKAIANLALWTMLDGNPGKADAMMLQAKLPDATRQAVHQLAASLQAEAAPRPVPPGLVPESKPDTFETSATTAQTPTPAAGVPTGMLDRFGNSHPVTPR